MPQTVHRDSENFVYSMSAFLAITYAAVIANNANKQIDPANLIVSTAFSAAVVGCLSVMHALSQLSVEAIVHPRMLKKPLVKGLVGGGAVGLMATLLATNTPKQLLLLVACLAAAHAYTKQLMKTVGLHPIAVVSGGRKTGGYGGAGCEEDLMGDGSLHNHRRLAQLGYPSF